MFVQRNFADNSDTITYTQYAVDNIDINEETEWYGHISCYGSGKIIARTLQDSLPATLHIIASLMNNSFKSNTFARVWKLAEVTCVPDGEAGNPCNNQLLPVLSNVNERLAHRQFVNFLDDNNKLSQFQSGNSKHHSTETALLAVTDDLLKLWIKRKSQYWCWWTCQKPVTV